MRHLLLSAALFSFLVPTSLPAQEATPAASPSPVITSPAAAAAPVELYSLDYDEDPDLFLVPGTKTPYTGPIFSNYDDGKKESVGALKNGQRDGQWQEYSEEGKLISEGAYEQGVEVGPWKYWSETGTLLSDGVYGNGKPVGTWKTFFDDGKPESEGAYVDGVMTGKWKVYNAETGAVEIKTFKAGVQTSR